MAHDATKEKTVELKYALSQLTWFEREFFKYYVKHDHSYRSLREDTKIPRSTLK